LLRNETVLYSSPIHSRSASLFPLAPKKRILILTDFPRLVCVKEDPTGGEHHKVKAECVFLSRRSAASIEERGMSGGAVNLVTGVVPKGSKTLIVQTVSDKLVHS
jgi:3-phosphoinositide dependent protein kinase-1